MPESYRSTIVWMKDDIDAAQFTLGAMADAIGCPNITLSAWRTRHGLFAEAGDDTNRRFKLFNVIDVCVARALLVATRHGLAVPDAVWLADQQLRPVFAILLQAETPFSSLVAFDVNDEAEGDEPRLSVYFFRRNDDFGELIAKTTGVITVIDLMVVIRFVLAALADNEDAS